jgi:hypothetical protein
MIFWWSRVGSRRWAPSCDKLPPPLRAFPSSSLPPECCESKTEIHLGHGPSARRLFVGHFFLAIGRDRLLDLLRPILSQAERRECDFPPIGTAPARGYIPSGPRDRLRPPLAASPCRSRVRRAARAQGRDSYASSPRASRYAATASSHPALLFGKRCKSKAEIHLGRGPFLWPDPFLQGVAMGRNCLLDPCWVFLLITERFRARPRFVLVVAQ